MNTDTKYILTKEEIMNYPYVDHINTPELVVHIEEVCYAKGKKSLLLAPTGTGKTTCELQAIINRFKKGLLTIIIVPTSDLAIQITSNINRMADELVANCILGRYNDIGDNAKDSLVNKWLLATDKIKVISQSAISHLFNDNNSHHLIIRDAKSGTSLYIDEASSIVSDSKDEFRGDSCNTMWKIMETYDLCGCAIRLSDATATTSDKLSVFSEFDVYDFTKAGVITFSNNLNLRVFDIKGKNTKEIDGELIKMLLKWIKEGGSFIYRCDDIAKNDIISNELNRLLGEDITYSINSRNKRDDNIIPIMSSIYNDGILPEGCRGIFTTKLLDKGVSICNKGLLSIFIYTFKSSPEELTQFISRARCGEEAVVVPYNKRSNICNVPLHIKKDIVSRYTKALVKQATTFVKETDLYKDENSILTKELDELLNNGLECKGISHIAIGRNTNEIFNKFLNFDEILSIVKDYKPNVTITNDNYFTDSELETLDGESLSLSEDITELVKNKKKDNKEEFLNYFNTLCPIDIIDFHTAVETLYYAGHITKNYAMSKGVDCSVKVDNNGKLIADKLMDLTYKLNTELGVEDFTEAMIAAVNSNNKSIDNIELMLEVLKVKVGKEFKSTNGELVKAIWNCIDKMVVYLIDSGKAMTAKELDDYITLTINTDVPEYDTKVFNMTILNIKNILGKITTNKEKVDKDKEGKSIRKTLFTGIKTNTEIYSDYVAMLNKLGVKSVKSVERLINKQVLEFQPF